MTFLKRLGVSNGFPVFRVNTRLRHVTAALLIPEIMWIRITSSTKHTTFMLRICSVSQPRIHLKGAIVRFVSHARIDSLNWFKVQVLGGDSTELGEPVAQLFV
jgi:hypothetical protein